MTFLELEWERPVLTHPNGTIVYKKYADKFFWLAGDQWIEIEPNYEYNKYVYK